MGESMERSIGYAKKYLEDLLSFYGLNTDVHASHSDEVIELDIASTHLNAFLIGQNGDTLRALQYVVSSALKNQNYEHIRVSIDIAGYKKQRDARLEEQVKVWAAKVKESGEPMELRPMNSAERRVVHQAASDLGLATESIGEGRARHILLCMAD
jgi:spoIIIJ-associated protein